MAEKMMNIFSLPVICVVAFLTMTLAILKYLHSQVPDDEYTNHGMAISWPAAIAISIAISLFASILIAALAGGGLLSREIVHWLSNPWKGSHFGLEGLAAVTALSLFLMRKRARTTYGITEVLAGLFGLSVYPVAPPNAGETLSAVSAAWIMGVLSLIYIIIRGLDNIDVGLQLRREKVALDRKKAREREALQAKIEALRREKGNFVPT